MYMLTWILIILGVILLIGFVIGLQGLVYWGMGAFICWAFQIPFEFTFIHGIALAFIVSIISSCFEVTVNHIKN